MNQKGGSVKTTTTINIAAALGEVGKRVLVVDLDGQANASEWLGVQLPENDRTLLDVLMGTGDLSTLVRSTAVPGVDLIAASEWLGAAEKGLAGEIGAEFSLRRALDRLPNKWDFILVDCQPSLGILVISALAGCHEVFVPVEAASMALRGLASLMKTLARIRERLNPDLRLTGILACRVDSRTRHAPDIVDAMRERFGREVLDTVIRENTALKEAHSFAQPITIYRPRCTGADDYRAAAAELLTRVESDTKEPKKRQRKQGKQ